MTKLIEHRIITSKQEKGYVSHIFPVPSGTSPFGNLRSNTETSKILSENGAKIRKTKGHIIVHTHGGVFHADEVSAISMLLVVFFDIPITVRRYERKAIDTRISLDKDDKFNCDLGSNSLHIILDIGLKYNFANSDFILRLDHHQDPSLPASNVLLANYILNDDFFDVMKPFLDRISFIDTNKSEANEQPTEYSALVRAMNIIEVTDPVIALFKSANTIALRSINGNAGVDTHFLDAISFSNTIISNLIAFNISKEGTKKKFEKLPVLQDVAISTVVSNLPGWQEIAVANGIKALLTKDSQSDGYVLISPDTTIFKIEPERGEIFIHASRFLAKYRTFQDAVNAFMKY